MTYGRLEKEVLVEALVKDRLYSEALGVAQRHNLNLPRYLREELRNTPGLKPVPNTLLQKDEFCPSEVYLQNAKKDTYLTMQDMGFQEEDVIFLDKVDKNFEETTKKLMEAKTVGVDAEFSSDLIGYSATTIAILQLATEDMAVIIDFKALENNDQLYDFCCKFFGNENIEKVGHTFTSDIKCLRSTFKDKPMEFVNIINIDQVFSEGKQKFGLAQIIKNTYGKEFSKYNQQSNWDRRPLRRSQVHYAALDAVATLNLLLKIRKDESPLVEQIQPENYSTQSSVISEKKKDIVVQHEDLLEDYKKSQNFKFLTDGMLKNLALNLRNIGLDAVFAQDSLKAKDMVELAELEDRIILTRDRKLIETKKSKPLIRMVSSDPYMQLRQIITLLGINVTKASISSRCVECNTKNLERIDFQEAQKTLKWENEENNSIQDFWRCLDCQKIYWLGGSFDRAQKMFSRLIKSPEMAEGMIVEALETSDGEDELTVQEGDSPATKKEHEIKEALQETIEEGVLEEINELLEYK